jgi:hypothetical protein
LVPSHLVAIYQQDRFKTGSSLADLTAVSRDGGRSWHPSHGGAPAFSHCTGGKHMQATDPRVAIGVDGTVYAFGTAIDRDDTNAPITDTLVGAVSRDGGETWGAPFEPYGAGLCEQSVVVADRFRAGRAYWIARCVSADFNTCFGVELTTTDWGKSWSPTIIDTSSCADPFGPGADGLTQVSDGSLTRIVRVMNYAGAPTDPDRLYSSRSTDLGRTWSPQLHIDDSFLPGTPLRTGFPVIAADPRPSHREVYAVWPDGNLAGTTATTRMAISHDGGETWAHIDRISSHESAGSCLAAVAVNDDGVVGVSYMDNRFSTTAQPSLIDGWIVTVGPGGLGPRTESRLTNASFDADKLPVSFTGDYHALVAGSDTFHPIIVLGNDAQNPSPTDAFTRRVTATSCP